MAKKKSASGFNMAAEIRGLLEGDKSLSGPDRKSVASGKSVDLGGRRTLKKKKNTHHTCQLCRSG